MPQIFVFVASGPRAGHNLALSIENPIDEETVFGSFAPAQREGLERVRAEGNGFYAWGAGAGMRDLPTWEAMRRGDYALCVYGDAYRYVARVLARYENEGFARRLWGEDGDGESWKYMCNSRNSHAALRPFSDSSPYTRPRSATETGR